MMTKRSRILPLMTTFNFCETTQSCGQRDVTTVPTQALALLNNDFVHRQSVALARRVRQQAASGLDAQIEMAWHLALGRSPEADEAAWSKRHVRAQDEQFGQADDPSGRHAAADELALVSLCHVLLNTNEFIYVD